MGCVSAWRTDAYAGKDHAEERNRIRQAQTVSELTDTWSNDGALTNRRTGARRSQTNIDNDVAQANHHLKPLIGSRTLESLIKGDIERLRTQIASGQSKTKRKGRKRGVIKVKGGEGPLGASGGIGLPLIGGILGHRQASTTQRAHSTPRGAVGIAAAIRAEASR